VSKPSEREEEYFARIEFERRKKLEEEKHRKLKEEDKKRPKRKPWFLNGVTSGYNEAFS